MDIAPDYELIESIKKRLRNTRDIIISAHALSRLKDRLLTEEPVKDALHNPVILMHVEIQKDDIEVKYRLIFRKSGKYDLLIVIRFLNSHIKVITAHIQNKKRIKIQEKWRKRLRFRR